jgi:hypothetical protein
LLDELGVDPIFHALPLPSRNGNRNTVDKADKRPGASASYAMRRVYKRLEDHEPVDA